MVDNLCDLDRHLWEVMGRVGFGYDVLDARIGLGLVRRFSSSMRRVGSVHPYSIQPAMIAVFRPAKSSVLCLQ